MKALLLCAGFGTRMRPLTDTCPKAALPFLGRPLVAHTLAWLARHGVTEVVLNLHHLGAAVRAAAEATCPPGLSVSFAEEPDILGTAGALAALADRFAGEPEVLLVNGDAFLDIDLWPVVADHRRHRPAATLTLTADGRHRELFGVGVDTAGRIRDFWGAPSHTASVQHRAFIGVHLISPDLLAALPRGRFACMKEDGYLPLLRGDLPLPPGVSPAGRVLRGVVVAGAWHDLGTPERYLAAHAAELHRAAGAAPAGVRAVGSVGFGSEVVAEGEATVGPDAFVGSGARLAPGAVVRRAVVWDGVRVVGRLEDAVASPAGIVRAAPPG